MARTNLTSRDVYIEYDDVVGEGAFRVAYGGQYVGGNRNMQDAVCKRFKSRFTDLEDEYYNADYRITNKAIEFAHDWNDFCKYGREILITQGDIMEIGGVDYMVEPLIRYFTKFTSNNGWISDDEGTAGLAMEAFSHYTYHRSGGQMIVCDLQGRYRYNKYSREKCRFELTDVAICSRRRSYGPTDLGEKGIESFFANHECNEFCNVNGYWQSPRNPRNWFQSCSATSMFSSEHTYQLQLNNRTTFRVGLNSIMEANNDDSDDDDDSW